MRHPGPYDRLRLMKYRLRFPRLGRTYRHVVRLRHILDVLVTEGFGFAVVRMNLHYLIRFPGRVRRYLTAAPTPLTLPEQLRRVIEELGPTFIKLGQMLASRPDLLPAPYIQELSRLHDHVRPVPFSRIKPVIESELGRPLGDVFARFDEEPVAAASLAQVYAAALPSGEEVVVKVLRPGVAELIRTDVEILSDLAALLAARFPELAPVQPRELVEEFAVTVKRELDFAAEAGNTDLLRRNLAPLSHVRIPKVYWDHTTSRVLVLEKLAGFRADDVAVLRGAGVEPGPLAVRIVDCFMKQVFEDGFYHADPHAGNVLISRAGEIMLVDCGAVGFLTADTMQALGGILLAIGTGDYERVATEVLRLGAADEMVDLGRFKNDAAAVVGRYYAMPFQYIHLGTMFEELSVLARRNGVRLPRDLFLLAKTVALVETLARRLEPALNLVNIAEPYARRLAAKRLSPVRLAHDLAEGWSDLNYYLRTVPRELDLFLKRAVRGRVRLELEHRGLDRAVTEIEKSSNRLSFAFIISAIIVSSAMIFVAGVGPEVLGYSALGIVGFVVAVFLGLWLAVAMLRSGRL